MGRTYVLVVDETNTAMFDAAWAKLLALAAESDRERGRVPSSPGGDESLRRRCEQAGADETVEEAATRHWFGCSVKEREEQAKAARAEASDGGMGQPERPNQRPSQESTKTMTEEVLAGTAWAKGCGKVENSPYVSTSALKDKILVQAEELERTARGLRSLVINMTATLPPSEHDVLERMVTSLFSKGI